MILTLRFDHLLLELWMRFCDAFLDEWQHLHVTRHELERELVAHHGVGHLLNIVHITQDYCAMCTMCVRLALYNTRT